MAPQSPPPTPPHYVGHRQRLRQRFLNAGADGLADYELLEIILFGAIARGDVKPLAKRLLAEFGDIAGVFAADIERLRAVDGVGEGTATTLKAVYAAAGKITRAQVINRPAIASWDALIDYCQTIMAHASREEFRVLFLDRKNHLIDDTLLQRGTVDHTPVYPREVVRRALDIGATALILVHNHPSGDPTPSEADITMTKHVISAAAALGITVHDHVIVARGRHRSFRSMGLI